MRSERIAVFLLSGIVLACGTTSESEPNESDAAVDSGTTSTPDATSDADVLDAGSDVTAVPDGSLPRCANSTYTTAPSGAACDPSRIVGAGIAPHCSGITEGTFCDSFGFSVAAGTAPPAGFTCTFELGIAFCQWRHGDGGTTGGKLESLAIEQACAVTVANPAIQVSCIVYE